MARPRAFTPFAETAPALRSLGYSVIPILPPPAALKQHLSEKAVDTFGKAPGEFRGSYWRPMLGWQRFKDQPADAETFARWMHWPRSNVGLPAGQLLADKSTLAVLDDDHEEGRLPAALRADLEALFENAPRRLGRKGSAWIFALLPCDARSGKIRPINAKKDTPGFKDAFDFMVRSGQIVLPPSIHPKTNRPYEWVSNPLDQTDPADLPRIDIKDIDAIFQRHGYGRTEATSAETTQELDNLVADGFADLDYGEKMLAAHANIKNIATPRDDRSANRVAIAHEMIRRGYNARDFAALMAVYEDSGLEKYDSERERRRQIARSYAAAAQTAAHAGEITSVEQEVLAEVVEDFHPTTAPVPVEQASLLARQHTAAFIAKAAQHAARRVRAHVHRLVERRLKADPTHPEIDDLSDHAKPPGRAELIRESLKISVGSGKSHAAAEAIADYIKAGPDLPFGLPRRVAILVPDHALASETLSRLIARNVSAAVYRGPNADNPTTGQKMCGRYSELEYLESIGVDRDSVCGTKKNGCPLRDTCAYLQQRQTAALHSVVIFAGPAALRSCRPWFGRTARVDSIDLFGNPTRQDTPVPAFDFLIIDEFNPVGMLAGYKPAEEVTHQSEKAELAEDDHLYTYTKDDLAALTWTKHAPDLQRLQYKVNTRLERLRKVFTHLNSQTYPASTYLYADHLHKLKFSPKDYNELLSDLYKLKLDPAKLGLYDRTTLNNPNNLRQDRKLRAVAKHNRRISTLTTFCRAARQALHDLANHDDQAVIDFKVTDETEFEAYVKPLDQTAIDIDTPDDRRVAQFTVDAPKPGTDLPYRLKVSYRLPIAPAFYPCSMLVMDASMDNDLAARTIPHLTPLPEVIATDGLVYRSQITDETLSKFALKSLGDQATLDLKERLTTLCEQHLGDVGLVTYKYLSLELDKANWPERPKNLKTLHFGKVRGQNALEKVDHLMIFGRPSIRVDAVEAAAWLLKGVVPGNWQPLGSAFLTREQSAYLRKDGTLREATRQVHSDPWVDRVRRAMVEEELVQAEGRGRAARRGPGEELTVEINTSTPMPGVRIDEFSTYGLNFRADAHQEAAVKKLLRAGVVPVSKPLAETYALIFGGKPATWRNRLRAAKRGVTKERIGLNALVYERRKKVESGPHKRIELPVRGVLVEFLVGDTGSVASVKKAVRAAWAKGEATKSAWEEAKANAASGKSDTKKTRPESDE